MYGRSGVCYGMGVMGSGILFNKGVSKIKKELSIDLSSSRNLVINANLYSSI